MIYYETIKSIPLIFSYFGRCLSESLVFIWNHSDSIRNLVTSAGIIAAGCWFYQRRQQLPRANLTHKIIHKELDKDTLLIHITVTIKNIGNVLIEINHADVRIHWVTQLTQELDENITQSENKNDLEIDFPMINSKELNFQKHELIKIEPGETHNIDCDFILRRGNLRLKVTTIMIYCYIRNVKFQNRPLGWSFEEFYSLD